jgi:Restriction endonuclease
MADFLVAQTSFPDLEGWEDAEMKQELARKAVSALKEYVDQQCRQADRAREAKAAQAWATSIQEEARKREMDLQKFTQKLADLSKHLGTQEAGYEFQEWFHELVVFFEIVCRRPYVAAGRQIDGSVTVDGTTYLVELKFTTQQAGTTDIDTLHKKVASKADNTMGILISLSGFSTTALKEASGPKTTLLLFDYNHIYAVLGGRMTFEEMVSRVRRHPSQTGEAYLSIQDIGG